jgi:hypothetical protein
LRNTGKGRKNVKILFLAAILLTTTTAAILLQNQNTYPLINIYAQRVSQGNSAVIREKTIYLSSDYNFTGNISETINVTADNIVINGNGYYVLGPSSSYSYRYGFELNGRSNVTVMNVIVTGWGYGFYLSHS